MTPFEITMLVLAYALLAVAAWTFPRPPFRHRWDDHEIHLQVQRDFKTAAINSSPTARTLGVQVEHPGQLQAELEARLYTGDQIQHALRGHRAPWPYRYADHHKPPVRIDNNPPIFDPRDPAR